MSLADLRKTDDRFITQLSSPLPQGFAAVDVALYGVVGLHATGLQTLEVVAPNGTTLELLTGWSGIDGKTLVGCIRAWGRACPLDSVVRSRFNSQVRDDDRTKLAAFETLMTASLAAKDAALAAHASSPTPHAGLFAPAAHASLALGAEGSHAMPTYSQTGAAPAGHTSLALGAEGSHAMPTYSQTGAAAENHTHATFSGLLYDRECAAADFAAALAATGAGESLFVRRGTFDQAANMTFNGQRVTFRNVTWNNSGYSTAVGGTDASLQGEATIQGSGREIDRSLIQVAGTRSRVFWDGVLRLIPSGAGLTAGSGGAVNTCYVYGTDGWVKLLISDIAYNVGNYMTVCGVGNLDNTLDLSLRNISNIHASASWLWGVLIGNYVAMATRTRLRAAINSIATTTGNWGVGISVDAGAQYVTLEGYSRNCDSANCSSIPAGSIRAGLNYL